MSRSSSRRCLLDEEIRATLADTAARHRRHRNGWATAFILTAIVFALFALSLVRAARAADTRHTSDSALSTACNPDSLAHAR